MDSRPVEPGETLEQELEQVRGELQDTRDAYVRTLADFDNYRKRVERDREEIGAAGKRELILGIIDIADNFERAVSAAAAAPEECTGIEAGIVVIYRQIQRLLETHGVTRFESLGERFDPERHEATGAIPDPNAEEGTIIQELSPGYLWNGRLLRAASVIVAR
jgi:molecular chaperone GrpE